MSNYTPTIGLEIHAELKTRTKMFCDSKNDPDEKRPNVNVCPVCMGHPGTLPVINKEAVRHVLKIGLAVGGRLADFTEFDRKNYFYPDIPKGYQISQYKYPLVSGGSLKGVELTRVHLEEDTARSSHEQAGESLVDFNRAGIPLMELVTEPVIKTARQAAEFARELQLLLQYLGAGEANMEKGEMRVEANISVSAGKEFGTKVEIKNLNSFRTVERAIEYEIERQVQALEAGETLSQETRGWDESSGTTFSQRSKETSEDYRYFPDPDLPKLFLSEIAEFAPDTLKEGLPELPQEKRDRYEKEFGIKKEDIEVFVQNKELSDFFEESTHIYREDREAVKAAANYLVSDVVGILKQSNIVLRDAPLKPAEFADLIRLIKEGVLSSRGAKDVLAIMIERGGEPDAIAEKEGLVQKSDKGELVAVAKKIIEENEKVVGEYRAGKESALQYLIGQGMKETKGSANPSVLKEIFQELL